LREIYQKYFALPEEGKGTMGEQVFFARLAVSIVCIVLCMSAMGFSAYAYFTASVSSSMNQIQAASFDLEVQKIEPQTETSSAAHEGEKTYTLQPGVYDFVLTKIGNASTGYGEIKIGEQSFYTDQIGVVDENGTQMISRTVRIAVMQETIVEIIACWGSFSGEPIREAEEMIIADGQEIGIGGKSKVLTTNEITNTPVVPSEPAATSSPESTSAPSVTITPSENQDVTATEPPISTENTEQPDAGQ